jgi:hypothetical protein
MYLYMKLSILVFISGNICICIRIQKIKTDISNSFAPVSGNLIQSKIKAK